MKPSPRRPSLRRRLALLTAATLVAAPGLIGAAANAEESPSPGDEKLTFTVGMTNQPDSFNPFLGIEIESYEMWALTYDYLVSVSPQDLSPQPALATDWESSEDGLTWTFDIREGVMWSDGEPLTAADIAFTYNRIIDGGPEAGTWEAWLRSAEKVTAPDDTTLVIEMSKPNAAFPMIPVPIVPQHVWSELSEKEVKSYGNEPPNVVGSGPFRLVEGSAGGSTIRFEKNPDYWRGTPNVDEVVFRVFKAADPAVQALKKGEIDFVSGITPTQVNALEGEDGITASNSDYPGFDEIAFNAGAVNLETGKPIGDANPAVLDPKFRFALGFAIDREAIRDRVYEGAGEIGSTIIPPFYPRFHWEPPEEDAFTFDLERAGQLLDEAGYTVGSDGLRTLPDGKPIGTLRLIGRSDSETSLDVLQYFQEWLGELGIDAEVQSMESSKLTNVILDGEFDVFEWGWYVDPDPGSMLSYLTCGQREAWSDTWYCNEEYDQLYDQQQAETDEDARAELIDRMQEIAYYDAPYLLTVYNTTGEAWRSDRWEGFVPMPDPGGMRVFTLDVHNYIDVRPVSEETAGGDEGGLSGAVVGGLVVGGIAVAGVIGALAFRRRDRATAEDRE
ncbi:MAG TPA: ABC transporter substrate-binding protein [Nocardioidaceae bacterium]|nr:ABC transporter substrate-binding protein [Nocardioidaceae bacterium]